MAASHTSRKPTFFWQGALILLPVAVLAVVSLVSLRRDEQAAEQAARRRAAGNVQSLARAIRSTVNDEIHQFLTLQKSWTMDLCLASQPSSAFVPDDKLTADITRWEREYPGLKLSELAVPECDLLADGRQIDPRSIPFPPVPPKWFRELSPKQRELWEALRPIATTNVAPRLAVRAFMDSGVSQEAALVAGNLASWPPEKRIFNGELSESGISFRSIAFYRLFQNPATRLSNAWAQQFWQELFVDPSFITPTLLDMVERRTNGADAELCEKLDCMRRLWQIQSKARDWLASVRQLPELGDWGSQRPWTHWTTGAPGDALAIFMPAFYFKVGNDLEGVPFSGRGYKVLFVPRRVMESIFAKALAENRYLVPEFAGTTVAVQGMPLILLPDAGPAHKESLLGSATQTFGNLDSATFGLEFYLTSREQMLSAEHRRAVLFILLILGTLVTAVAGLIGARQAFCRQLELNELKSNFVSSVSHELRAPIASVRLMAENLEGNKIPEPQKQKEYFGFIVQECRRLSALIENVLDFSRIEQGRKQYEFEPTDLVALVNQTVTLMQPNAAEKQVQLVLKLDDSQLSTLNSQPIEMDGRAIQQALVNLIDNAIKHSPKGETVTVGLEVRGAECGLPSVASERRMGVRSENAASVEDEGRERERERIDKSLNPQPSTLNLYVGDHGPGIPPEEHEKIFERFYRRGSELRRETQGVGIGLSIVKHIVEAHGGRVLVESAVGQGSRFTIELPMNPIETTDGHG